MALLPEEYHRRRRTPGGTCVAYANPHAEELPMSRRWHKLELWCTVISEPVTISLRRGGGFLGQPEQPYVHCDQRDCQYVDVNRPPCPLTIEMFKGDLDERVRTFLEAKPDSAFCHACVA